MQELTIARWRKYGRDRLYVSAADGTPRRLESGRATD
jgi:hypothetical protein